MGIGERLDRLSEQRGALALNGNLPAREVHNVKTAHGQAGANVCPLRRILERREPRPSYEHWKETWTTRFSSS